MAEAVVVEAKFVADTTQLVNNLRRATESVESFSQSLPDAEKNQDRVKASSVALGAALGTIGAQVFAKATGALQKYTMQGIEAAKQYEQTVISIEGIFMGTGMSMEQSAAKTKTYLADLRDFAAKTPFELPQILDATKRLLSIGYAADDVKNRMLPAIGDIVAALGQPPSAVSAVVYAMGQMKSAGRVMSQDLMQIGNALPGFNAKMALAKELFQGDMQALTKAMESGTLDSSKAIDVLITAMTKFGGAAGAMDRQSKTLAGVISTFNDTVNNALIDGLMPALPGISEALNNLMPTVSELATTFASSLGPVLMDAVDNAQTLMPAIQALIPPLLEMISVGSNFAQVLGAMSPVLIAIANALSIVVEAMKLIPTPIIVAIGALLLFRKAMTKTGIEAAMATKGISLSWSTLSTTVKTKTLSIVASLKSMQASMTMVKSAATRFSVGFRMALIAAGGAVKGFLASIGPVGWAIMAVGAAFEIMAGRTAAATEGIELMSSALDEASGKMTEMGRQEVLKKLTEQIDFSAWEELDKVGLGLDEAMTAIEQGGATMDAFFAKLDENHALFNQMGIDYTAVGNAVHDLNGYLGVATGNWAAIKEAEESAARSANLLSDAYKSKTREQWSANQVYDDATMAMLKQNNTMKYTVSGVGMLTTVTKEYVDEARQQQYVTELTTGAQKALAKAVIESKAVWEDLNAVLSEEASWDNAVAKSQELGKALKKGVDYTKNNTKAQREGRAAIRDVVSSYVAWAQAAKTPEEAQRRLEKGQKELRKTLKQKGIKATDIDVYKAFDEANKKTAVLADEWTKAAAAANVQGIKTGKNFIDGVLESLAKGKGSVETAAAAVGQAMPDAANAAQEAQSPARKGVEVGKNFVDGVVVGLRAEKKWAAGAAADIGKALIQSAKASLKSGGGVGDVLSSVFGNIPEMPTPLEAALGKKGSEAWLKKHKKELWALQEALSDMDKVAERVDIFAESMSAIGESTKQISGTYNGEALSLPSALMAAVGKEGNAESAIAMLDQLTQSTETAFAQLIATSDKAGKKVYKGQLKAFRTYSQQTRDEIAGLMIRRQQISDQLERLESDYQTKVDGINQTYDILDKAAADSLKAIEDKWAAQIPVLEAALEAATQAFDTQNAVLEDLVQERDNFLKQISSGFRSFVNEFSTDKGSFKDGLDKRLAEVRQFTTNIRSLISRGLDPTLIRDFIEEGVSGAGGAVAQLAQGSADDIAQVNAAQAALASEIAGFQSYASQQWFDAGIAQQEAIVAPLRLARDQAKAALDAGNATRASELAAAQKHIDDLKAQRDAALTVAQADYTRQKEILLAENKTITETLTTRASEIQAKFTGLQETLPPQMREIGREAVNGIIKGMEVREDALMAMARRLGSAVKRELERSLQIASPSKVTKTIGQQIAEGLIIGMKSSERAVAGVAGSLAGTIVSPAVMPNFDSALGMPMSFDTGGGATTVNNKYEITIQSLAGDKRQIGREVVEAIKAFERTSGPVYQPASI